MDVQDTLRREINKIADNKGLFVLEVKVSKHKSIQQIKVIVDKNGGVLLDDCARLSKELSRYIETSQVLNDNFSVEVASPGIDRKFASIDDFLICAGRKIKVSTKQLIDGKREFIGKIIDASGVHVVLLLEDNQQLRISLNNIKKAKLEIGWKK